MMLSHSGSLTLFPFSKVSGLLMVIFLHAYNLFKLCIFLLLHSKLLSFICGNSNSSLQLQCLNNRMPLKKCLLNKYANKIIAPPPLQSNVHQFCEICFVCVLVCVCSYTRVCLIYWLSATIPNDLTKIML